MKFKYSYNTHRNERREGLVISAPNRDAAYSELNRRGIRPYRLEPVPGLLNRLLSLGWRGPLIAALCLALAAVAAVAFHQYRDIAEIGNAEDVRELAKAITSKVRRQLIGDQGVIERGIRTGWSDVFDNEGERFLASFAIPGVPATVRRTNAAALREALAHKVEATDGDGMESRQIKAVVDGMKDELRRYIAVGGTIEKYEDRLVQRQNEEIAYYTRFVNEIEQAVRSGLGKAEIADLVDRRNGELRRIGVKCIQMPDTMN